MTAVLSPIVLDENGVAWIEGTTTKVIEVVLNKEWTGQTAEELQQQGMPHLTLAQIYAALSYYHAHKEELDTDIERRRQFADQLRSQAEESPFSRRMREAGRLP
jgi:uncharacterized protein (DUF433 family)